MQEVAPRAQDMTHKQYRYKKRVDEIQRAKNRTKSRVRSKVEHVFGVMKLKFGFVKVRYRGLKKNANRLFATCALVNLFLVRKNKRHRAQVVASHQTNKTISQVFEPKQNENSEDHHDSCDAHWSQHGQQRLPCASGWLYDLHFYRLV